MSDIFDLLIGIDKRKEIFDLWYEVTYLRVLLSELLSHNPELFKNTSEEGFENCKLKAQEIVKARFPNAGITFDAKEPDSHQHSQNNQEPETPHTNPPF